MFAVKLAKNFIVLKNISKIRFEEHLLFERKRGKTSKNGHLEPMG